MSLVHFMHLCYRKFWNEMKAIILLMIPLTVFGHGNIKHSEKKESHQTSVKVDDSFVAIYKNINAEYKIKVEAIFKGKCFDCHSGQTVYPWYYKIPGVNLLIDSDIKEARSHLDMSDGFPFKGHGTPMQDLGELEKTVKSNSMPPLYYKLFHDNSSLTEIEKKIILKWIRESKMQLKSRQ